MDFLRKKILISVIFFLLFYSTTAFAQLEVSLARSEYSNGETVQARITTEKSISETNIKLLDNQEQEVSIPRILTEIGDEKYFLYFDPPQISEGTYTLVVSYKAVVDGVLTEVEGSSNFSIVDTQPVISINPAMIWLTEDKKSFSIKISNKGTGDVNVNIESSDSGVIPARETISLTPQELKNLYVNVNFEQIQTLEVSLTLSYDDKSYVIPIFVQKEIPPEPNCTDNIKNRDERGVDCGGVCEEFDDCCNNEVIDEAEDGVDCGGVCEKCPEACYPNRICEYQHYGENTINCPNDCFCGDDVCDDTENYSVCPEDCPKKVEEPVNGVEFLTETKFLNRAATQDTTFGGSIKFKNYLNTPLHNLVFSLTGNLKEIVSLNITTLNTLEPRGEREQYIWVNNQKNAELGKNYFGNLTINTEEGHSASFQMQFLFTKKETKPPEEMEKPSEPVSLDIPEKEEEPEIFINFTEPPPLPPGGLEKNVKWLIIFIILVIIVLIIMLKRGKRKRKPKYKRFKEMVEGLK